MADILKELEKIQKENNELKAYKKDVEKTLKKLANILPKTEQKSEQILIEKVSDFEEKISSFYGLYNKYDKEKLLEIMLNDSSKSYFNGKRYGV